MGDFNHLLVEYNDNGIEPLRKKIPEIKKLESLDDLQDLEFLGATHDDKIYELLVLSYRARASPSLYSKVKKGSIPRIIAKKKNIVSSSVIVNNLLVEFVRIHIRYYDSRLQIFLDLYNPNKK